MPYKQITQLPDNVKNNLPKHAQEIYKEAFNSAEDQYGEEDRAPTVSPGALWKTNTRRTRRVTGSRRIADTPRKMGAAGVPHTGAPVLHALFTEAAGKFSEVLSLGLHEEKKSRR
jgi:cation transport regulator